MQICAFKQYERVLLLLHYIQYSHFINIHIMMMLMCCRGAKRKRRKRRNTKKWRRSLWSPSQKRLSNQRTPKRWQLCPHLLRYECSDSKHYDKTACLIPSTSVMLGICFIYTALKYSITLLKLWAATSVIISI